MPTAHTSAPQLRRRRFLCAATHAECEYFIYQPPATATTPRVAGR